LNFIWGRKCSPNPPNVCSHSKLEMVLNQFKLIFERAAIIKTEALTSQLSHFLRQCHLIKKEYVN